MLELESHVQEYRYRVGEGSPPQSVSDWLDLTEPGDTAMAFRYTRPWLTCGDGSILSIQAGQLVSSTPKGSRGPYTEVEVGSDGPVGRLETYVKSARLDLYVYGYVPVELVWAEVQARGGPHAQCCETDLYTEPTDEVPCAQCANLVAWRRTDAFDIGRWSPEVRDNTLRVVCGPTCMSAVLAQGALDGYSAHPGDTPPGCTILAISGDTKRWVWQPSASVRRRPLQQWAWGPPSTQVCYHASQLSAIYLP